MERYRPLFYSMNFFRRKFIYWDMDISRENKLLLCICFCFFFYLVFLQAVKAERTPEHTEGLESAAAEQLLEQEQQLYWQSEAESALESTGAMAETDEKDTGTGDGAELTGSVGGEAYQPPLIRVLLTDNRRSGYLQERVTVTSECAVRIEGTDQIIEAGSSAVFEAGDPRFADGKIILTPENPSVGIQVTSLEKAQGAPVYEGSLEICSAEQGIYLVNAVDLETYLKYVVPSEMPASYAAEALKAQAVCARTYACRQMADSSLEEYHADVDDSVSYQVYNNIMRQATTDQAVDATAGQIMTCGGKPIIAYFFSTSCGYTSTDEVWSGSDAEGYLKSVYLGSDEREDVQTEEVFASFIRQKDASDLEAEDGWYRWSVTIPVDVLEQRTSDRGIGKMQSMEVLERSSGGAASALRVTGSQGSFVLENEYDIRELLSVKGIPVTKNDGTVTDEMYLLPSAYFICSAVYDGENLTGFSFVGGGYGHGVGMSQNGASHLADQGLEWQEILSYFYENIQIETIDGE